MYSWIDTLVEYRLYVAWFLSGATLPISAWRLAYWVTRLTSERIKIQGARDSSLDQEYAPMRVVKYFCAWMILLLLGMATLAYTCLRLF